MNTKKMYQQPQVVAVSLETEEFSQNPLNQGSSPLVNRPGVSLDNVQSARSYSPVLEDKVSISRSQDAFKGLGDDMLSDELY